MPLVARGIGDELAAGPDQRVQPLEEAVVVEDPVEGRRGEDRVDVLAEFEREQVDLPYVDRRAEEGAGLPNHLRRGVDGDHPAAWKALYQVSGDAPRAAAGVEDRLVADELEAAEDGDAHRLHRTGDPVVALGVPVDPHYGQGTR
jgi:hypothetical protein